MSKKRINDAGKKLGDSLDENVDFEEFIQSDEAKDYVEENFNHSAKKFNTSVEPEFNKFGYQLSVASFAYGKMITYANDLFLTDKEFFDQLNKLYNQNYLNTEDQMYTRMGSNINDYREHFDDDKGNFVYLTKRDQKVRDEHRLYDGIVKPKDDPWWDQVGYAVLNQPNCRCAIRSTNKPQNDFDSDLIENKWSEDPVGYNIANVDWLWPEDHTYIENYNKYLRFFNKMTKKLGINEIPEPK